METWKRLSTVVPLVNTLRTWTAQTAKLRNELSNVISSRVSLGWLSVSCLIQRGAQTFSLWLYGLNILK